MVSFSIFFFSVTVGATVDSLSECCGVGVFEVEGVGAGLAEGEGVVEDVELEKMDITLFSAEVDTEAGVFGTALYSKMKDKR
jgi:hypothetical protein